MHPNPRHVLAVTMHLPPEQAVCAPFVVCVCKKDWLFLAPVANGKRLKVGSDRHRNQWGWARYRVIPETLNFK